MEPHDLARNAEPDTCPVRLCREERGEDIFLALLADRLSVIGDIDYDASHTVDPGADADPVGSGLDCILEKIDGNLCNLVVIGVYDYVF